MNKTKINILFLIAKNRMNTSGKCAIKCRITYNKQRHEFSTGLFINPKNWSSAKQQAVPLNTENTQINTQLSLIKQEINQAFSFTPSKNPYPNFGIGWLRRYGQD